MNRRSFLQRVSLAVAGLAIDPERLLWTPGERVYFDLGLRPYRVQYGDWLKCEGSLAWQQWVMTAVNGRMYGCSAIVPHGAPTVEWYMAKVNATRAAEKELDRLVRWAQQRDRRWSSSVSV